MSWKAIPDAHGQASSSEYIHVKQNVAGTLTLQYWDRLQYGIVRVSTLRDDQNEEWLLKLTRRRNLHPQE